MLSLSDNNQADVNEVYNSTSKILLLIILFLNKNFVQ